MDKSKLPDYKEYFADYLSYIENSLDSVLPRTEKLPEAIHEAMRYSVLGGGKRFRSLLSLLSCEACGKPKEEAILPALSVELIHAYSLVHDDLPAMDNDEERRGKPTCHIAYGEDIAILAGDGLLTLAFHILADMKSSELALKVLRELSTSSGTHGMIGGQVADILAQNSGKIPDAAELDFINVHKTGHLIKAATVIGGISAEADESQIKALIRYGECLGLAFQVVDDVLDGDGYLAIMKEKNAASMARDLIANAKRAIHVFGKDAEKLNLLADYLLMRLEKANI